MQDGLADSFQSLDGVMASVPLMRSMRHRCCALGSASDIIHTLVDFALDPAELVPVGFPQHLQSRPGNKESINSVTRCHFFAGAGTELCMFKQKFLHH